jgi:hypothetical protein
MLRRAPSTPHDAVPVRVSRAHHIEEARRHAMSGHQESESGKEFSPDQKFPESEESAAAVKGSGRKFDQHVDDPETDPEAERAEGSGKAFSQNVKDAEADPDAKGRKGSGKQFEPGRDEL